MGCPVVAVAAVIVIGFMTPRLEPGDHLVNLRLLSVPNILSQRDNIGVHIVLGQQDVRHLNGLLVVDDHA